MSRGNGSPLRVLLVKHNSNESYIVKKVLEDSSDIRYVVDWVETPQEALDKIQDYSYNVLLVELNFEEENNVVFLDEVRDRLPGLPFILMAPTRNDKLFEEAKKRGVTDFLVMNENDFQSFPELIKQTHQRFTRLLGKKALRRSGGRKKSSAPKEKQPQEKLGRSRGRRQEDSLHWFKDQLTGLYSHSFLHDRLNAEFQQAHKEGYPISCLMLDIGAFKEVNAKWGHRIGDEILQMAAKIILDHCRLNDIVARYGGGEFAVLIPHCGYDSSRELAYRLSNLFSEHVFFPESKQIRLTVSIGMASYPEDSFEKSTDLFNSARQALFRSKATGRNNITLHKDILPIIGADLPVLEIGETKVLEFQRQMSEIATMAKQAYIDASKTLIKALEGKDSFTAGHATRCARYSRYVAEMISLSGDECEVVEHAALIHDVGKICIPDQILLKPSKLTFDEFEIMKQHAYLGYKIIRPIKFLKEEAEIVLHHHEWFNGEGYPSRLKEYEIPLGARIISVADAYDTMRNAGGRYRKTISILEAVRELITCAGAQFDPRVVQAFLDMLEIHGALLKASYDRSRLDRMIDKHRAA